MGSNNAPPGKDRIRVRVTNCAEELTAVYRIRYDVYVRELRRNPPDADHERQILSDFLDEGSEHLGAFDGDRLIGAIRNTFAANTDLGYYEEFYGFRTVGDDHPALTSMTTAQVVLQEHRGARIGFKLPMASFLSGLSHGVRWNFIDCIPSLLDFFKHIGYREHLQAAPHPTYGFTVHRLRLDLWDIEYFKCMRSPFHRWEEEIAAAVRNGKRKLAEYEAI